MSWVFWKKKPKKINWQMMAIADVFRHSKYGIVSHQPMLDGPLTEKLRIMDVDAGIRIVFAGDCVECSPKEKIRYWKELKISAEYSKGDSK